MFGQQISILDRGVGWAGDIFLSRTDRNVTTQVASRSVREAQLKWRQNANHCVMH